MAHRVDLARVIYASVPVIEPPEALRESWEHWVGCGPELLLVDNTTDGAWADLATEHHWSYLTFGKNAGVSSGWNQARAWFLGRSQHPIPDALFLFSSTMQFTDGLPSVLDQIAMHATWKGCQTQYGPHAMAWGAQALELVGTWDENYFPGYLGDTDYFRRAILEGIIIAGPEEMPRIEINAPKPEDGRTIRTTGIITNTAACTDYYRAKHGGVPTAERFTTPFDSGLPTWWWSVAIRPGLEHIDLCSTRYR